VFAIVHRLRCLFFGFFLFGARGVWFGPASLWGDYWVFFRFAVFFCAFLLVPRWLILSDYGTQPFFFFFVPVETSFSSCLLSGLKPMWIFSGPFFFSFLNCLRVLAGKAPQESVILRDFFLLCGVISLIYNPLLFCVSPIPHGPLAKPVPVSVSFSPPPPVRDNPPPPSNTHPFFVRGRSDPQKNTLAFFPSQINTLFSRA